jgi:hypothetical protein
LDVVGRGEEEGLDVNGVCDCGVEVGAELELLFVGLGVGVKLDSDELDSDELDSDELDGLGTAATDDFGGGGVAFDSSSSSSVPASNTTKFAFDPSGTVTTQKLAPPAPFEFKGPSPSTSFTLWTAGSIAHGRPLQGPSHSILTPHVGISSRNGVSGSR